jgi:putative tryptophan/tyrosine transport system substrate-binding protein
MKAVLLLTCFVLGNVHFAEAQQSPKIPRIGWLSPSAAGSVAGFERLRGELHRLGYVDGKNLLIESRYAEDKLERLPTLADELVRLKVDVLVTRGTPEAIALKNATKTIPIVFYTVTDPVGAGLVDSLARPGGNITGFSSLEALLAGKRLELLKETVPKLTRVAVLWNPQDLSSAQQWKESQTASRELNLQLYSMEVSRAGQYESAFKEAINARSASLAVIAGSLEDLNQQQILDLATRNRLPAMYPRVVFVTSGGLMSYGAASEEAARRAALMVDKILKGAKPADLPVEQAAKFDLVINLNAAKKIGLTIPQKLLVKADRVIK